MQMLADQLKVEIHNVIKDIEEFLEPEDFTSDNIEIDSNKLFALMSQNGEHDLELKTKQECKWRRI